MAICLVDGEIFSVEKNTIDLVKLQLFFLNDSKKESLVAVYDNQGIYIGVISYQSFLGSKSIEDALMTERVYLDEQIWINASNILYHHSDIGRIPILATDDNIVYIAENRPELAEQMIKLSILAKDDEIWRGISAVYIKGINEVLFYLEKLLERKGVQIFVEENVWGKLGVFSDDKKSLPDVEIVEEDGVWIEQLYSKLEASGKSLTWNSKRWKTFCDDIKEKNKSINFGMIPDAVSDLIYDSFLQEGILPKTIFGYEQFRYVYGKRMTEIVEGSIDDIWCLTGSRDDIRTKTMFEIVMRKQRGCCENIYLLSGVEYSLTDNKLSHMICQCGKVVLMGERRVCGLFERYCNGLGKIEVSYIENIGQPVKNTNKSKAALWFYLDFPTQEAADRFRAASAACMLDELYLSRYFLDHYMFYEDEHDGIRFTNEEHTQMKCLKQMQILVDDCLNQSVNKGKHQILFLSPYFSFLWDGIFPLFKYYIHREETECTVVFPSVWDTMKEGGGARNLKETVDNILAVRKLGGIVRFYNNWNSDKEFDVCYTCLGYPSWYSYDRKNICNEIYKTCKFVISLQTIGYHTHYYIGDKKFEDMFSEQYRGEVDYVVVSSFMAEWVKQKEGIWNEKLLPFGYPRMDSLYEDLYNCPISSEWKKKVTGKKVIYFTVFRIDLFTYCLEYCKRDRLVLIWRPHPYDFDSPRIRKQIEELEKNKNVIIDINQSYSMAFNISDALVTTFCSSVQINYWFTGKPVLILDKGYLGWEGNQIDFQEEPWYKAAYAANDGETCREFIDMVIDGRDDKKQEKLPYRRFMQQGFDGKVCERIATFIDKRLTSC